MADDQVGNAALVRELRLFRERQPGDTLRLVASFRCPSESCPVALVKISVIEEPGKKKMQPPCRCPRSGDLMVYIGLELTR